jgi:hypothetical protein
MSQSDDWFVLVFDDDEGSCSIDGCAAVEMAAQGSGSSLSESIWL